MRTKIAQAVKNGRVLIADGAWGTMLHQKGLRPGQCPEEWCLSRFEDVRAIAESYIQAGADMVKTNSFGGTRYKLEHFGLAGKVGEINEAAARASREAAGDGRWVIASAGPTGQMLITEDITGEEMADAFREQITALERGGADAVCIETMSAVDEAVLAIRAAKENTGLEVICTFSFEKTARGGYRTMMGVSPAQAAKACAEAGADIVGTNCGNGVERMVEIVREIRAAVPDVPIMVNANAGMPQVIDGKTVFPDTPEEMARFLPELIAAGAGIIGGCCGTTPGHIAAMKKAKE